MDINVRTSGPNISTLARQATRDLTAANKQVGKQVAKAGTKAGGKGAPSMMGRKLRVRSRINASARRTEVELYGSPAGAWTIADTGADPHPIKPRKKKVLRLGSDTFYAHVDHPGVRGRHVWTQAIGRMEPAVADAIEDVYDKAVR